MCVQTKCGADITAFQTCIQADQTCFGPAVQGCFGDDEPATDGSTDGTDGATDGTDGAPADGVDGQPTDGADGSATLQLNPAAFALPAAAVLESMN
jgi:hypothetical protein